MGEEFKFHLVSWFKECSLIYGGLRVRNLLMFNCEFLQGSGYDATLMRGSVEICRGI